MGRVIKLVLFTKNTKYDILYNAYLKYFRLFNAIRKLTTNTHHIII